MFNWLLTACVSLVTATPLAVSGTGKNINLSIGPKKRKLTLTCLSTIRE